MRTRPVRWCAVMLGALGLALPAPALATIVSSGTGEPAFTNATVNRWWFTWNAASLPYKVAITMKDGDTVVYTDETAASNVANETFWVDNQRPNGTWAYLQDGHRYTICVTGYKWMSINPAGWYSDGSACEATTADLTPPTVATSVNGTDEYTNDPVVDVVVEYADAHSSPWPGGISGNGVFACIKHGGECEPTAADWVPGNVRYRNADGTSSYFAWTSNLSAQPDGKIYWCAKAPDEARPDPGTTEPDDVDQFTAPAQASNVSARSCGWITLDRGAPSVGATASATTATVGQLVTFSASASDPLSGVSGAYAWTFGDNTAPGTGASVGHTYTQPGTYQARVETSDGAGNAGAATVTVTVAPAQSGGGTSTTAPPVTAVRSGGTVTTAPTTAAISQQVGGGGTQRASVGGLSVTAPKRAKITRRLKQLPLALTATSGGKVTIALVRSGRIVARGGLTITGPGTFGYKLKLPKTLRKGTHLLKVTFQPKGSAAATTKTLKIRFVK